MVFNSIHTISCFSEIQIHQKASESSFHRNFTVSENPNQSPRLEFPGVQETELQLPVSVQSISNTQKSQV